MFAFVFASQAFFVFAIVVESFIARGDALENFARTLLVGTAIHFLGGISGKGNCQQNQYEDVSHNSHLGV
jgi:hypothetical protein